MTEAPENDRRTLSERLAAAQARRPSRFRIRALLPEIDQALENGFSLADAWRDLKRRRQIACCLGTFRHAYRVECERAERIRSGRNANS